MKPTLNAYPGLKILATIVILLQGVVMQSCIHPACNGSGAARLAFYNFDSAALEKVIVRRYDATSNFTALKDSSVYFLSKAGSPLEYVNTGGHFVKWPFDITIKEGVAAIVEVVNVGKIYYIKDVADTHATNENYNLGSSSKECYNEIKSYNINGNNVNTGIKEVYGEDNYSLAEIMIYR